MTVNYNDNLQKILRGIVADDRFTNWLWFLLNIQFPNASIGRINSPGRRDLMLELIKAPSPPHTTKTLITFIEQNIDLQLLPNEALKWITDDTRQNAFIIKRLTEFNGDRITKPTYNLEGKDLTIATLDIWDMEISQKTLILEQIKKEWLPISKTEILFRWFDNSETRERLELAWDTTQNKYLKFENDGYPESKEEFINNLDSASISAPEITLLMDSIKKRWSQKKYREKQNGKKQYNFILPEEAINQLDRIAKKHNLKRTEVLELLLRIEDGKGAYIEEWIASRKALLEPTSQN